MKFSAQMLARAYTKAAVKALAGIVNDEAAEASIRVLAAKQILDRAWGKSPNKSWYQKLREKLPRFF